MKNDLASAMHRATELVRAGNPTAATEVIQSSLSGTTPLGDQSSTISALSGITNLPKRSSLRETLEKLATTNQMPGLSGVEPSEPVIPQGARFDRGTFTCSAGSRDYRVYIPDLAHRKPAGMIMMLHGCTQNPVDFANGTDMNRIADRNGLIVVYPAQSRGANMQSCWNWFAAADQNRDAGEPAILAGLATKLRLEHKVPEGKVFVAGLSAGAAMAVILGKTYPEVFAGVGAHSGLPYKSASDLPSALAAMGGTAANTKNPSKTAVPTIVFHGTSDATVNPINGQRIADDASLTGTEMLDDGTSNGRTYTRTTIAGSDSPMEYWRINGLGHAWSGGKAAGSYTDPNGPDASSEMVRFFLEISEKRL